MHQLLRLTRSGRNHLDTRGTMQMAKQVKLHLLSWAIVTALLSFNLAPVQAKTEPLPKSKSNKVSRTRVDTSFARSYAQTLVPDVQQFECLTLLWNAESGWNHKAHNRSSGAYGIPQSLPANKMRSAGADYLTNPETQIRWGLSYIANRYQTPCGAWAHFKRTNWY
jgi:hypothetical protein